MEVINPKVVNPSLSHFTSFLTLEDPNPISKFNLNKKKILYNLDIVYQKGKIETF